METNEVIFNIVGAGQIRLPKDEESKEGLLGACKAKSS